MSRKKFTVRLNITEEYEVIVEDRHLLQNEDHSEAARGIALERSADGSYLDITVLIERDVEIEKIEELS